MCASEVRNAPGGPAVTATGTMTNVSLTDRLFRLLLAVAFLAATGTQAYGLRPCPIHDAVAETQEEHGAAALPGTGQRLPAADAVPSSTAAPPPTGIAARVPQHGHSGADAACTCVGDCCEAESSSRAALSSPPRTPGPGVRAADGLLLDGGELRLGPRHSLFELHLPNAPPLRSVLTDLS